MNHYFETSGLSVGYNGKTLIRDICVGIEKGKILTLIGPNGAGKSTILKSITKQLALIHGTVSIASKDISEWSPKEMARQVAVVLTDRIRPELMTSEEVVAMGRYPYTNMFGKLTPKDTEAVRDALARVHATELAGQDFGTLSDGQRQRVLLARAICQEPGVLVLDEPTAYLDIRHKVELLDILRDLAQNRGTTIILSLHEIDLAMKISDYLMCVKGDTIAAFGTPEEVLGGGGIAVFRPAGRAAESSGPAGCAAASSGPARCAAESFGPAGVGNMISAPGAPFETPDRNAIERLYDMESGSCNLLFGSIELAKPLGRPRAFVVAGCGYGIACYRLLQKKNIPFATGILFPNDVDYQVAAALSDHVVCTPPFEEMSQAQFDDAAQILLACDFVVDAGTPVGTLNKYNGKLLGLARERGIAVYSGSELRKGL